MKPYISVRKMAKMHNTSRQTLIYYDKIGLFKPHKVDKMDIDIIIQIRFPY